MNSAGYFIKCNALTRINALEITKIIKVNVYKKNKKKEAEELHAYHISEWRMWWKKSDYQSEQLPLHAQRTPQTSHKCPGKSATKWALLTTRSSGEEEEEEREEAQALGREAPGADSWQLSGDTRIDLTSLPLQLQERVCFPGGGEVMLSKWTKISGSSSSSSSSSPR